MYGAPPRRPWGAPDTCRSSPPLSRIQVVTERYLRVRMSECKGPEAVATKVDWEMLRHIDEEAERIGATRAEYLRLVLDMYRSAAEEGVTCSCGQTLRLRV